MGYGLIHSVASEETKIKPCPVPGCGAVCEYTMTSTGEDWDPNAEHSIDCIACGYKYAWDGGSQNEVALEIAAHNSLYADIKRGRMTDNPIFISNKYLLGLFREWCTGSDIGKRSQLPGPVIIKLIEEIERLKGIGCLREQVDKEQEIAELKHNRCDHSNCASRYIK